MRRKKNNGIDPKYILAALIVFCCIGIFLGFFRGFQTDAAGSIIDLFFSPMQRGVNTIGGTASSIATGRADIATLESEVEELENQNAMLASQLSIMENNQADYDDLLSLMELEEKYPNYDMTGARIIAKDPGNWYSSFTINKGSLNGIRKDMNVIAEEGLVGIVTRVSPNSAVVRSIIDDTSSVSGMISKNYDICIVNGDLTQTDSGLLSVEMISADSAVVNGDEIVTSYISDKYLPGIRIGYISDVQMDKTEMSYNASLTPVVDFQHLSTVLVIKQLKSELSSSYVVETEETSAEEETEADTVMQSETAEETGE